MHVTWFRFLLGAAVAAAASVADAGAQPSKGGAVAQTTAFVPLFGFPPLTHNSSFVPFPGFRPGDPSARFPLGLCCVTGAAPESTAPAAAPVAENRPPESETIPTGKLIDAQGRENIGEGVVILRGSVPHG